MRAAHWASLLFVAGLAGGAVWDEHPERPAVLRGGLRVVEADFHAHTRFSDGFLGPPDLVLQAERRGLDVLAVTEHNIVFPGRIARAFSRLIGGPLVLVGEEITTRAYHVHGVGLTERVDASLPLQQALDEVHRQGGVTIAAHPVRGYWPALQPALDKLDAAEVMHPRAFAPDDGPGGRWRWQDMRDFYLEARASGHALTAIGSSDYHFFSPLGVARTFVFVDPARFDAGEREATLAVLTALRTGRTVVHDLRGRAYGDPALVALLEREPLPRRDVTYQYRGRSWADRLLRALGWLGLVGILALSPGGAPPLRDRRSGAPG